MLIALALAAATSTTHHHRVAVMRAALRPSACNTAACAADPRPSRYRLGGDGAVPVDTKSAALATDGSECSVVGARVCTHKPRTILTADLGN